MMGVGLDEGMVLLSHSGVETMREAINTSVMVSGYQKFTGVHTHTIILDLIEYQIC